MTSQYDIGIYKEDLMLIEKWYIKLYGLKDGDPPSEDTELYEKILVLRKNEAYLESVEAFVDDE